MATLSLVPAVEGRVSLADARRNVLLTHAVDKLVARAGAHSALLQALRITVVSSTASGGGVSEMLHSLLPLMGELGIQAQWLVLSVPPADAAPFFTLTKALHNALHSSPHTPTLCVTEEQAAAFERVGADCARDLVARWLPPRAEVQDDSSEVIMLHDPQPLAMALHLRAALPRATLLWRCHIGSGKEESLASRGAWAFLSPYLEPFTASIFSNKAYFPPPGAAPASQSHFIIPPGINPCSSKNRALSLFECAEILTRAGLLAPPAAVAAAGVACAGPAMFAPGARIYLGEGQWQDSPPPPAAAAAAAATTTPSPAGAPPRAACIPVAVPFLTRPVVSQISRWDRLKGWSGLVKGFAALKADKTLWEGEDAQNICASALCLVGPDPGGVTDDVEGAAVLLETCALWDGLPPGVKSSVFLVLLPMEDLGANAVMVNAIQSASFCIVQNSLEEGFGLTVLEAMYKRVPVIGTAQALGISSQITDGVSGLLTHGNPNNERAVASSLATMLGSTKFSSTLATNGQARAIEHGLMYGQAEKWLSLVLDLKSRATA